MRWRRSGGTGGRSSRGPRWPISPGQGRPLGPIRTRVVPGRPSGQPMVRGGASWDPGLGLQPPVQISILVQELCVGVCTSAGRVHIRR